MRLRVPVMVAGAVTAMALGLAACGGDDDSTAGASDDAPDEILIAAPLELTGPVGPAGTEYLNSLEFGVEKVNAAGGIKSKGGAKLRLLVKDTESDPAAGPRLLQEMHREGAIVSVGPLASSNTVAVKPTNIRLRMPWVGASSEPSLTEGGTDGIMWRVLGSGAQYTQGATDFLKSQADAGSITVEKIGILAPSQPPGPDYSRNLEKQARANGWETVTLDYDFLQQRDFSSFVARLRDADVDTVMGVGTGPDTLGITEAVSLQDWRPRNGFLWVGGFYATNGFREAADDFVQGWMDATNLATESTCETQNELSREFERKHGKPLVGQTGAGPAIISVIAAALEEASDASAEALSEALADTQLEYCEGMYGMLGGLAFDGDGNNESWKPAIVQFEGKFGQVAVGPDEAAARKPKWPAN